MNEQVSMWLEVLTKEELIGWIRNNVSGIDEAAIAFELLVQRREEAKIKSYEALDRLNEILFAQKMIEEHESRLAEYKKWSGAVIDADWKIIDILKNK